MTVPISLWDQVSHLKAEGLGIDDIMVRLKIAKRFRDDVKRIVFGDRVAAAGSVARSMEG